MKGSFFKSRSSFQCRVDGHVSFQQSHVQEEFRRYDGGTGLNISDLSQCPRCLSRDIVEVHGHYQCRCGFDVSECCQGECAQPKFQDNKLDQLDKMITICDSLIRKHSTGLNICLKPIQRNLNT